VAPVAASSATTAARPLQHSYFGSIAALSSPPEIGTKSRPWNSVGAPVTCMAGPSAAITFQTNAPVAASSAWTWPRTVTE
jgi:hypothetical protein